jgi:hypothetical protein
MSGFWSRLGYTAWARSLEFVRDRGSLSWSILFPFLLVAGLAYVFSGPAQPAFTIAVLAPPGAALDGSLHPFLATRQIRFFRVDDLQSAVTKVQRQRIDMLLDLRSTRDATTSTTSRRRAIWPSACCAVPAVHRCSVPPPAARRRATWTGWFPACSA